MFSPDDHRYMQTAFALAEAQRGRTGKNPAVGCVIVSPDGEIIGRGATQDGGSPHAEASALLGLSDTQVRGATAYVTLEPCRVRSDGSASCSTRLIEAGIARLVYAVPDPHPKGAGGANILSEAGVRVEHGLMEDEAISAYAAFFASVSNDSG